MFCDLVWVYGVDVVGPRVVILDGVIATNVPPHDICTTTIVCVSGAERVWNSIDSLSGTDDGDMCKISLAIYFDEKVSDTGFVIADLSECDVLAEDIVEHPGGPSAAADFGADESTGINVIFGGNLTNSSGSVVPASVGFVRILDTKLVHEFRHVLDRDGLTVGQSAGSRSAGGLRLLRFYGRGCSGLSRVANLAELAVDCYAGAYNFAGAGVYGRLRVRIGDIPAGVSGVLHHAVDYNSGLSAVHDAIAIERTVGITSNNAEGIHVGDGITVLAGDAVIICNLIDSSVLVRTGRREALLGHDVGHELGHVIPGDTLVHACREAGTVNVVSVKAYVVPDAVVLQREIVGVKRAEGQGEVIGVFLDVAGIERSGQHDDEVGPGYSVGRLERAVCIAADDALVCAPDDCIMERVRAGYVAETQDRRESVRNCVELGILRDAGIANRTVGVDVRVILDGEGRDGQGQCHNNRKSCRNKTADVVMGAHIRLFHVCVLSQISFSHGKVSGRIRGTVSRPPSCFAGGRIWGYAWNLP